MALSHTILTLLLESAYTGYDIGKLFEDTVSFFWKASHQQIYRELSNMEHLGWVESEAIPQTGKPDKKLYCITETGRKELETWMQSSCTHTQIREDLLVKVMAGYHFPKSALVQQLKEQLEIHHTRLKCYLEKEKTFLSLEKPEDSQKFRYFTLRRGIRYEKEWVEWCKEVLSEIEVDSFLFPKESDQNQDGKPP